MNNKFVTILLVTVIAVAIFALVSKNRFNENRLDTLVNSEGSAKPLSKDPCGRAIYGEPVDADNYVKVTIKCADKQATSKLMFSGLVLNTWADVWESWRRINGIDLKREEFDCNIDSGKFDWADKVTKLSTMYCNYVK